MSRWSGPGATRSARAFAPAHLTGYFLPQLGARDPRGRGSVGAGLVLGAGVTAEASWTPGKVSRLRVSSGEGIPLPISEEVARRLAPKEAGLLQVHLAHELPVGQGFGASASGALATALAVGEISGTPRQRAIEVAHLADLFGGGGLGGVAAILGGGLEWRATPGVPPFGRVVHRTIEGRVFAAVVGRPIATGGVLGDPATVEQIRAAADRLGSTRRAAPTLSRFLSDSEQFTDELDLGGTSLHRTIRGLRGSGAAVAQAMFGRTVFAVPRNSRSRAALLREFERRRLRAVELPFADTGADLLGATPPNAGTRGA